MHHVSVIVPTKNRSRQLRRALASIRALEGVDLTFEILVIDNGSTDDSTDVARAFGARVLSTLLPGAAAARNEGLRSATAPFIAFLDDDDVWLPGRIRPQLALLERRPELSAVVGQMVLTDADMQRPSEPYPAAMPETGDLFMDFLERIPQLGATVARTSVRDSVGGFDPSLVADQDWDWHLRLALQHQVGFVAVPSVLFSQRAVGATADQHWQRLGFTRQVFVRNVRRADQAVCLARSAPRVFSPSTTASTTATLPSMPGCSCSPATVRRAPGAGPGRPVLTAPRRGAPVAAGHLARLGWIT